MTSSQSERQELQCSSKAFFGLVQNQGITRFLRKRIVAGWYPRMAMAMMLTQGCVSPRFCGYCMDLFIWCLSICKRHSFSPACFLSMIDEECVLKEQCSGQWKVKKEG